jgi:hypothetical protein
MGSQNTRITYPHQDQVIREIGVQKGLVNINVKQQITQIARMKALDYPF